ncbi:hypothetical protein B0H11DRAFT_1700920, partial [Mycena galericulata]
RPKAVKDWLARARNWGMGMNIGEIGAQGEDGTFAGQFWIWWSSLQPADRVSFGRLMSCPDDADWSAMAKLHGKNGLLQVMAALLWWGEAVTDDEEKKKDWSLAVGDVTWVLEELGKAGVSR